MPPRRRGSAHIPKHLQPQGPAPSATAATAALQAFRKNTNDAALAAAAAGTALRQHATSPISVADTQTKRLQRKGSNGSRSTWASESVPDSPVLTTVPLNRRNSVGSLKDRTLRGPSPSRGSPAPALSKEPPPPVPQIPSQVAQRARASSFEPPNGAGRGYSPVPRDGRGASLDRGPTPHTQPSHSSTLESVEEVSRENSRRSINFSRPISPQNLPSQESSPKSPKRSGWFTGPVISGQLPRGMDKQRQSEGRVRAQLEGKARVVSGPSTVPISSNRIGNTPYTGTQSSQESSELSAHPATGKNLETGLQSSKWSKNTQIPSSETIKAAVDSHRKTFNLPGRQSTLPPKTGERVIHAPKPVNATSPSANIAAIDHAPVSNASTASNASAIKPSEKLQIPAEKTETSSTRTQSLSPVRKPHFTTASQLNGVRHEPLDRSASPVKSAMKRNVSAVRGTSPQSETATTSDDGDDNSRRRRSIRFSLEDPAVESTAIAYPQHAPAPQEKIVKSDEDLEALLKPRTALPSFSSIRGRSRGDASPDGPSDPVSHSSPQKEHERKLESGAHSSDHAVGGILRQSLLAGKGARRAEETDASKPVATGSNEPLPPDVLSREGTGFASDSEEEADDDAPTVPAEPTVPAPEIIQVEEIPKAIEPTRPLSPPGSLASTNHAPPVAGLKVPEVAVQPPTPAAEEELHWLVPGAFPESSHEVDKANTQEEKSSKVITWSDPPRKITSWADYESSDDSDSSSVYSDAAENPEELAAFASLDAVLYNTKKPVPIEPVMTPTTELSEKELQRSISTPESVDTFTLDQRLAEANINRRELEQIPPSPVSKPVPEPETKPSTLGLAASRWSAASTAVDSAGPATASNTKQSQSRPFSVPAPTMRRRGSADSDSSFRRHRTTRPDGKLGFKRTLRQETSPPRAAAQRNQSPAGSPVTHMRTSLRSSSGPSGPTLRDTAEKRAKSPSRFASLLMSSKSKAAKATKALPAAKVLPAPVSKFQSKYAGDSDEEVETGPEPFASRYADDSDDEDLSSPIVHPQSAMIPPPATSKSGYEQLQPVRGIPRKPGQDDVESTDLEDEESVFETPQRVSKAIPPLPSVEDINAAHGSYSKPSSVPRHSAGGLFRSKHAPSDLPKLDTNLDQEKKHKRRHTFFHFHHHPGNRDRSPSGGISSLINSHRKYNDEKTWKEPEKTSAPPASYAVPSSPKNNKLKKQPRSPASAKREDSWPLQSSTSTQQASDKDATTAAPPLVVEDGVPSTLDDTRPSRIELGNRRSTADDILTSHFQRELKLNGINADGDDQATILSGPITGPEKKKRFAKLRKALRMKK